jgi:hypothetical protein
MKVKILRTISYNYSKVEVGVEEVDPTQVAVARDALDQLQQMEIAKLIEVSSQVNSPSNKVESLQEAPTEKQLEFAKKLGANEEDLRGISKADVTKLIEELKASSPQGTPKAYNNNKPYQKPNTTQSRASMGDSATEKQVAYLLKLGASDQEVQGITKEEANKMITSLQDNSNQSKLVNEVKSTASKFNFGK